MVTQRIHHWGLSAGRAGRFNTMLPDVEEAEREILLSGVLHRVGRGRGEGAEERQNKQEAEGEYCK